MHFAAQASDDGNTYLEGYPQGVLAGYRASNMTPKAKGQSPLFLPHKSGQAGSKRTRARMLKNAWGNDRPSRVRSVSTSPFSSTTRRFPLPW